MKAKIIYTNIMGFFLFVVCLSGDTWVLPSDNLRLWLFRLSSIIFISLVILGGKLTFTKGKLACLVLVYFIYIFSYNIFHASISTSILGLLLITALVLVQVDVYEKLYVLIIRFFSLLFFIGIILYIAYLLDIIQPTGVHFSTNPLKIQKGVEFNSFYGLLMVTSFSGTDMYRFQSIFDEPGVVGTICGLLIISLQYTKLNLEKFIFFLAGSLSLSSAFFVFFSIFLLLSFTFKNILIFFAVFIILFYAFIFIVPEQILEALQWTIEKKIETGDNRVSDCFWYAYDMNMPGHELFGLGHGSTATLGCDISSMVQYVYDYGYVGISSIFIIVFVFYYIAFADIKYKYKTKLLVIPFMVWIIVLILNFYQRPFFLYPLWLLLGAGYFIYYAKKSLHIANFSKK